MPPMARAPIASSTRLVTASVTTTAMAMPKMPNRLPRRAVSGCDSPFSARMKRTLARRYQSAMAFADIATLLLHPVFFSGRLFLFEHLEHPLGHHEPAERVDRDQGDGERAEQRPPVDRTGSGGEDGTNHDDGADRVGNTHQRGMQCGRHRPDHVVTHEDGQDE